MKADKKSVIRLLKTARGQMEGILKMVEDDRYCIDIIHQIQATGSVLRKASREIISAHMAHCVKEAFLSGSGDEKVAELLEIMDRMAR